MDEKKDINAQFIIAGVIIVTFGFLFLLFPIWQTEKAVQESLENAAAFSVVKINQQVGAGEALLLDVRTEEELGEDGYAVGSTHFDVARLKEGEVPSYSPNMKIYTYCRSGKRAGEAQEILESFGFRNVENIGGLVDWEEAGGEVIRPLEKETSS